ncbi:MAG: hypothetical protein RL131_79 [Bacteroidota bacterium]
MRSKRKPKNESYVIGFWILTLMATIQVSHAQKRFSEGTLIFDVTTHVKEKQLGEVALSSHQLKGGHSRVEFKSSLGSSTSIFDEREGNGVILKEYGAQKVLIPFDKLQWEARQDQMPKATYTFETEEKQILGYTCQKAIATLADGRKLEVFYTNQVVAENADIDIPFGKLPGLALEYRTLSGDTTVRYVAKELNFDPVPFQRFEWPKTGYRVLTEGTKK